MGKSCISRRPPCTKLPLDRCGRLYFSGNGSTRLVRVNALKKSFLAVKTRASGASSPVIDINNVTAVSISSLVPCEPAWHPALTLGAIARRHSLQRVFACGPTIPAHLIGATTDRKHSANRPVGTAEQEVKCTPDEGSHFPELREALTHSSCREMQAFPRPNLRPMDQPAKAMTIRVLGRDVEAPRHQLATRICRSGGEFATASKACGSFAYNCDRVSLCCYRLQRGGAAFGIPLEAMHLWTN